jgi:hypothetical protein
MKLWRCVCFQACVGPPPRRYSPWLLSAPRCEARCGHSWPPRRRAPVSKSAWRAAHRADNRSWRDGTTDERYRRHGGRGPDRWDTLWKLYHPNRSLAGYHSTTRPTRFSGSAWPNGRALPGGCDGRGGGAAFYCLPVEGSPVQRVPLLILASGLGEIAFFLSDWAWS